MKTHTYTTETLVHYNCCGCGKWWSIADGPLTGLIYCPWCGTDDYAMRKAEPAPAVDEKETPT